MHQTCRAIPPSLDVDVTSLSMCHPSGHSKRFTTPVETGFQILGRTNLLPPFLDWQAIQFTAPSAPRSLKMMPARTSSDLHIAKLNSGFLGPASQIRLIFVGCSSPEIEIPRAVAPQDCICLGALGFPTSPIITLCAFMGDTSVKCTARTKLMNNVLLIMTRR